MDVHNSAMPLIIIRGTLRKGVRNEEYAGLEKEQAEVIQSYLNLREKRDPLSVEIVKGLDKEIVRSILFELKREEERTRRRQMVGIGGGGGGAGLGGQVTPRNAREVVEGLFVNSSTRLEEAKLEEINLTDITPNGTKLFQFEDDLSPSMRIRHTNY